MNDAIRQLIDRFLSGGFYCSFYDNPCVRLCSVDCEFLCIYKKFTYAKCMQYAKIYAEYTKNGVSRVSCFYFCKGTALRFCNSV